MVNFILIAAAGLATQNIERATVCPSVPTCPTNNGCIYNDPVNNATFQVACSTDYYGGNLVTDQTATYTDCLTACAVTQGCLGVSYAKGFCYLKSTIKPAVNNTLVTGATLSGTPKATPTSTNRAFCSGTITCPSYNNCIFSAPQNAGVRQKPFVLACSSDFYGGDLKYQSGVADPATCLNICALQGQCIGISYVAKTQTCYLKSSIGPALYNPNVLGAYLTTQNGR